MGQKEIYDIVKDLGGTAFPYEIKQRAKTLYPDATMHQYVYLPLKKMTNWGIVKKNTDGSWTIIDKFE